MTTSREPQVGAGAPADALAVLMELTSDGVLCLDGDGRIAAANRAAGALLRCDERALVGQELRAWLDAPALGHEPRECSARRADGSTVALEARAARAGALTLAVLRDVGERRLAEHKLLDANEQLRRQIGQDLHDGLGQLLTGTAFLAKGLVANVDGAYRPHAERVVELVNQAIARVRSLARGLSPIRVEARSLDAVLREVVAESSELLGVDCALELRDAVEIERPATMEQLCLIIREAITNAVRHGQARRIVVSLSRQGSRPVLQIEDDGVGIRPPREPGDGLGLRSMRHRAKMIGGTLEIERAASGTVVRCSFSD